MDWYLYKIRHLVENMFCRLKQFRGIATRYDKLKRNYQSSVAFSMYIFMATFIGLIMNSKCQQTLNKLMN